MKIDISEIVQAVIALITSVITAFVLPYIKSRTDEKKLEKIMMWAEIAVNAAEKIFKKSGDGEKKKAYVEEFLRSKGFELDADELDSIIEYKVNSLG